MNCTRARKLMLEFEDRARPAELDAHLEACEPCRQALASSEALRGLISLKKYEQPDAFSAARSAARIRSRIEELNARPVSGWRAAWEVLSGGQITALRYAAVAAVVLLITMNLVPPEPLSPLPEPSAQTAPAPAAAQERPAVVLNAIHPAETAPILLASNTRPGRVEYGPLPSRLVEFEY